MGVRTSKKFFFLWGGVCVVYNLTYNTIIENQLMPEMDPNMYFPTWKEKPKVKKLWTVLQSKYSKNSVFIEIIQKYFENSIQVDDREHTDEKPDKVTSKTKGSILVK